jgi:hypothetical protein
VPAPRRKPILIGGELPVLRPAAAPSPYAAGVCNIGPAEVARRRLFGHVAAVASLALLAALIALHVTPLARLLVALPAAGAAMGYIQAQLRFCAAYGSRGVYNFGRPGKAAPVLDRAARAMDRARSMRIGLASALIGLGIGILAVLLPL